MAQNENTIILDMGACRKEDITDLKYSEGKLYKKINSAIERLKAEGQVSENAQPIIAIVKQKKSSDW